MDQVRFVVLGTSMISDNFIEAVNACPRAQYVGSMGRSLEKAQRITRDHGGDCAFSCVEDVAAREDVDAVYIATPNAIHYDQALSLIRAGKHVLVEKPMASDGTKVARLFDAACDAGVVAMEAMRPVHDPGIAKVCAARPFAMESIPLVMTTCLLGRIQTSLTLGLPRGPSWTLAFIVSKQWLPCLACPTV